VANKTNPGLRRRTLLQAGATIGGLQLASPFLLSARGETPVKIGMIDPLTGSYAAIARSEVEGAQLAVAQVNKAGGVLGRQVQLLVEDSANDVGTGVQKAHKLIDRDGIDVLFGDVNSAIALAIDAVAFNAKKLHIVTGGHTDAITGHDCHWNAFRVCNSTTMDASAIAATLIEKFGKKWFFLTPDYAYGHSVQASFVKILQAAGGTFEAALAPIGTSDFSAYLIKAQQYKPNVLLNIMGGTDQVNSMKQFNQFGLNKSMAMAGALLEQESIESLPAAARAGWWVMEWYWNQPDVPHMKEFVADVKAATGKIATARHWFGYVAMHSVKLAAEKAKSMDGIRMAKAMEGLELPPEVALQKGTPFYRAGDHELMSAVLAGEVHNPPAGGDKNDLFTIRSIVPGPKAAGPVEDTGCKISWPA
jgi:branched-chain amino acid transport system substrate-binding protein